MSATRNGRFEGKIAFITETESGIGRATAKEAHMSAWTNDELSRIDSADELRIQSRRRDGTLRNPVTIWVVRYGGDLYVRSVNGRDASWFRGTRSRHEGRIRAGGVEKDVRFVETVDLSDEIDDAYRTKYRRYAPSIVGSVVTPQARAATLKLVPEDSGS